MRPLTAKRLIRILLRNGFVLVRQKGSHQIYHQEGKGTQVAVPFHGGNKPIPIGTFMAIVKQSKLPKEKFI